MEKLMQKLARLNHEIGVTETIISLIEQETVLDFKESIEEKRKLLKDAALKDMRHPIKTVLVIDIKLFGKTRMAERY